MRLQSPGANPPPALARPPRESWELRSDAPLLDFEQDKLFTTPDLLQQSDSIPAEGVDATYIFQRDCSRMTAASAGDYLKGAAQGAAHGAVLGAVGGLALTVLGGAIFLFSAGFIRSSGVNLAVTAGLGAVMGAGMGAMDVRSEHSDYRHYGESVSGKLQPEFGPDGKKHLIFHPGGSLTNKVDLEAFAGAPVIPGGEPDTSNEGLWWQYGRAFSGD